MGGADRLNPQGDLRNQRQASPASAEQAHQVITSHVFDNATAGFGGCSITAQQPNPDDLVADAEVPLAQATGDPAGDEPANTSCRSIVQTIRCHRFTAAGPVHRQPLILRRE